MILRPPRSTRTDTRFPYTTLFRSGQAGAEQVIGDALAEVLDDLRLRETVIEVGLDFNVGIGGSRLNAVQRQKLALARALLKRPDLLVANAADRQSVV